MRNGPYKDLFHTHKTILLDKHHFRFLIFPDPSMKLLVTHKFDLNESCRIPPKQYKFRDT